MGWLTTANDADARPIIQSAAVTAFTTALSYAPNKLETSYQLALQYAWQRHLEKSISSLSHSLHLDKSHLPSIHLLILVLTALGDYERALQTCQTVKLNQLDQLNLEDGVALLEMQLTYLHIVEVVNGRELALEVQKGVFKLYSQIFGPVQTEDPSITEGLDSEKRTVKANHPLRRTRSNINSEMRSLSSNLARGRSETMESKLSLQVPTQIRRPRSILRKNRRSRSVSGRSSDSRSSAEFSEKLSKSSMFCLENAYNSRCLSDRGESYSGS
jgi:tetratricopeptide (TPR) repeat protein